MFVCRFAGGKKTGSGTATDSLVVHHATVAQAVAALNATVETTTAAATAVIVVTAAQGATAAPGRVQSGTTAAAVVWATATARSVVETARGTVTVAMGRKSGNEGMIEVAMVSEGMVHMRIVVCHQVRLGQGMATGGIVEGVIAMEHQWTVTGTRNVAAMMAGGVEVASMEVVGTGVIVGVTGVVTGDDGMLCCGHYVLVLL